ncbi:hypothetical protein KKB18_02555, partial [bacterium]|nr:hypothetical protein [bacterium]
YHITKVCLDKGALFESLEEGDLLTELMDWSQCMATGLQNYKVHARIYEFYVEASKKRNEYTIDREY